MKIRAFFKTNGEYINVFRFLVHQKGEIIAVETIDGEMYGNHEFDIEITD